MANSLILKTCVKFKNLSGKFIGMEKVLRGFTYNKASVTKSAIVCKNSTLDFDQAISVYEEDRDWKNLARIMRILEQESVEIAYEMYRDLSSSKKSMTGKAKRLYGLLAAVFKHLKPREIWVDDIDIQENENQENKAITCESSDAFSKTMVLKSNISNGEAKSQNGELNRILTRAARKKLQQRRPLSEKGDHHDPKKDNVSVLKRPAKKISRTRIGNRKITYLRSIMEIFRGEKLARMNLIVKIKDYLNIYVESLQKLESISVQLKEANKFVQRKRKQLIEEGKQVASIMIKTGIRLKLSDISEFADIVTSLPELCLFDELLESKGKGSNLYLSLLLFRSNLAEFYEHY